MTSAPRGGIPLLWYQPTEGVSPYHGFNLQRGLSPFHDVISQFVRLTLPLVAGDVTIPPGAFIAGHFEFICHPWVAEFEDVDMENIDILVGYQLFITDFVDIKTVFSRKQGLF